jgi:hypothetical protein
MCFILSESHLFSVSFQMSPVFSSSGPERGPLPSPRPCSILLSRIPLSSSGLSCPLSKSLPLFWILSTVPSLLSSPCSVLVGSGQCCPPSKSLFLFWILSAVPPPFSQVPVPFWSVLSCAQSPLFPRSIPVPFLFPCFFGSYSVQCTYSVATLSVHDFPVHFLI